MRAEAKNKIGGNIIVLAQYTIRSKQNYIFKTNRIVEIVGASKLISNAWEEFFEVAERIGFAVIRNSGDEFDLDATSKKLEEHKRTVVELFQGGGNLTVLFASRDSFVELNKSFSFYILKNRPDMRPLTEQTLKDHLLGKVTVDTYVQRPNATVHFLVIDVDISRHILIQHERKSDEFKTYLQRALDVAQEVCKVLRQMGLTGYIEYSGNRGYHVWLFFAEWIQTRYANMLSDIIEKKLKKENDISVEFFPNKTRLKAGKFGQVIKLPYGIHGKTGERSYFLDEAGTPILEVDRAIDSFARASLSNVKKVIAANTETEERTEHVEVDTDISPFGDVSEAITEVLINCSLMRYLCLKSVKTGYLGHFERLMILYVFGHLGSEGQEFVHKVMSFTLNYKHHVTEMFIRKMPDKPVSCVKLRENFKQLTAEFGCSCTFKRNRNCYPSPVLHAISLSDDLQSDITLPATRTLTKEKETMVKAEINVRSKAQEVANKLLDVKKQRRGLDKIITKYEKELGEIFDAQRIDELELEIGVLRRRKNGNSVEWFIEI